MRIIEQKVIVKANTSQVVTHLLGMCALTVGVFVTLRGIFGGSADPVIDS